MGERDPRLARFALRGEAERRGDVTGLARRGILQSLQHEGISRGQIEDGRAGDVQDFVPIFDKSDAIKPIQRRTRNFDATLTVVEFNLDVTITPDPNTIMVIRSLSWLTSFGALGVPDALEVRFNGRQAVPGTANVFLTSTGPIPISNRVIGDVDSELTAQFNRLLPLSLLPGDRLVFRQVISPQALLGTRILAFIETHLAPFRPAGL